MHRRQSVVRIVKGAPRLAAGAGDGGYRVELGDADGGRGVEG